VLFFKLNKLKSDNKDEKTNIKKNIKNITPKNSIKDLNLNIVKLFFRKKIIKIIRINSDIKLLNINDMGNNKIK